MSLTAVVLILASLWNGSSGHGRLMEPPARSSMWRKGFTGVPMNYNDNSLFCGGFTYQWSQMGGKCGVCGDPYGGPRDHELGGEYYTDKIAATYTEGQEFTAEVQLTASHKGWFEFRLCAASRTSHVTQDCLDRHLLEKADGTGPRYMVTRSGSYLHKIGLLLPPGLTCPYCVLQWKYHAGNSWGTDPNGQSGVGRGPQEEFYGCANVAITSRGNSLPTSAKETDSISTSASTSAGPSVTSVSRRQLTPSASPATPASTPSPPSGACRAADGPWKLVPGLNGWCKVMCGLGVCPPSHCTCA